MFTALSLILNCPGLKLAMAVHKGLPIGRPLPLIVNIRLMLIYIKQLVLVNKVVEVNSKLEA